MTTDERRRSLRSKYGLDEPSSSAPADRTQELRSKWGLTDGTATPTAGPMPATPQPITPTTAPALTPAPSPFPTPPPPSPSPAAPAAGPVQPSSPARPGDRYQTDAAPAAVPVIPVPKPRRTLEPEPPGNLWADKTQDELMQEVVRQDEEKAKLAQQEREAVRRRQLRDLEANPQHLAAAILEGRILPGELEGMGAIPFKELAALSGASTKYQDFTTVAAKGLTDPDGGRHALLDQLKARETTGYDVQRSVKTAGAESLTFGAQEMEVPPQTGAGTAAHFATSVVAEIPKVMAVSPLGRAAAAPLQATRFAGAIPLVEGATIGGTLSFAREAATGMARPEEFDLKESAKRVLTNAAEYAAYTGVYSKLNPKVEAALGALGRKGGPQVEAAIKSLVGEVIAGGATGFAAGMTVGTGKALLEEISHGGLDLRRVVRNVLTEGGQEAGEEIVEGVALGVAMRLMGYKGPAPQVQRPAQATAQAVTQQGQGEPAPQANTLTVKAPVTPEAPKVETSPVVPPSAQSSQQTEPWRLKRDEYMAPRIQEAQEAVEGTKVVDDQGKPLVVYHGSGNVFTRFDEGALGSNTGAESAKKGFFFAADRDTAGQYGKNDPQQNVTPFHLYMQNPMEHDFKGAEYRDRTYSDIIQQARDAGNDGVILRNTFDGAGKTDVYVVFSPDQIVEVPEATEHEIEVRSALAQGLPVPPEVKAEYESASNAKTAPTATAQSKQTPVQEKQTTPAEAKAPQLEARMDGAGTNPTTSEPSKVTAAQVSVNQEKNFVEVKFPAKPSEAILNQLRAAKFRWFGKSGLWYAPHTPQTLAAANQIAGQDLTPQSQPQASTQATEPKTGSVAADQGSDAKSKLIAHGLQKLADAMQKDIGNLRRDRLENTRKRAQEGASARNEAARLEQIQAKLHALADAHEAGAVPPELQHIRTKAQVADLMMQIARARNDYANEMNRRGERAGEITETKREHLDYARLPEPTLHRDQVKELLGWTKGAKGSVEPRAALERASHSGRNGEHWVYVGRVMTEVDSLIKMADAKGHEKETRWMKERLADDKRLMAVFGGRLPTAVEFRQTLKALYDLGGKPKGQSEADRIKELERQLVGTKIEGYFPTPKVIVEQMLESAQIEPGMKVLEPSAGKGNIADLIKENAPEAELETIEIVPTLRNILETKGHKLVGTDFLEHKGVYDRIIMNPPFEQGQDMAHVRHAYSLLKPGGRLVSIMSEGPFFRQDRKAAEFRQWLDEVDTIEQEKLPEGSFKSSERPTGVATRLVVIEKPAEARTEAAKEMEPWQMIRAEYLAAVQAGLTDFDLVGTPKQKASDLVKVMLNDLHSGSHNAAISRRLFEKAVSRHHEAATTMAFAAGKPVPQNVLADYPELSAKAKQRAPQSTPTLEPATIPAFAMSEVNRPMTYADLEARATKAMDLIGTNWDRLSKNPKAWESLLSNPKDPIGRYWLIRTLQEQGKPLPAKVGDLMMQFTAQMDAGAKDHAEIKRLRTELQDLIQRTLGDERTFLERMLDGEEAIPLTGKALPPGAIEGKFIQPKQEPAKRPEPAQTAFDFDAVVDQAGQIASYRQELEQIRSEREPLQTEYDREVEGIAARLSKDAQKAREKTRRELYDRIRDRGFIRPYADGYLKEDLTSRIPSHLKRKNGAMTLDQIAEAFGYDNEEALVRDIEAVSDVKVTPQDAMGEAISLVEFGRPDLKSMLDHYRQAEQAVLDALSELEGSTGEQGAESAETAGARGVQAQVPGGSRTAGAGTGQAAGKNARPEGSLSVREELRRDVEAARGREGLSDERGSIAVGHPALHNQGRRAPFTWSDPDAEQAYQDSKGVTAPSMWERFLDGLARFRNQSTREWEHLPRTAEFAKLRFDLNRLKGGKGIAADQTIRHLQGLTVKLNDAEYDLLGRKLFIDDMAEEVKIAAEEGRTPSLPDPWTPDMVTAELGRIAGEVAGQPNVVAALDKRARLVREITAEYLQSAEEAVGYRPQLKREHYYRHQVLMHADAQGPKGTGTKLKAPTGRGFAKSRKGSSLAYNTEYIEPEFEWMSQMIYDTKLFNLIKFVKDKYDITKRLKAETRAHNNEAVMPHFQQMAEEMNHASPRADGRPYTADDMYRQTLNRKQAMGISKLQRLAAEGKLPGDGTGRFDALIEALADVYQQNKAMKADMAGEWTSDMLAQIDDDLMPDMMAYLSYVLQEHGGTEASAAAATVFKGQRGKQEYIKDVLGDRYREWKDMLPDGYTLWQPREGNLVFQAYSIPEQAMKQVLEANLEQLNIPVEELQQVMVMGGRRPEIAIPENVAATLDSIRRIGEDPVWAKVLKGVNRAWKVWTLISPARIVKYNLNNTVGDLDGSIHNAKAIAKLPQATGDLWNYLIRRGAPSVELDAWLARGGLLVNQQTAENLSDLKGLDVFYNIMEGRGKKEPIWKLPARAWNGYWRAARMTTDFREAMLRYANFVEYRRQMLANPEGKPDNWGASNREEIMALESIDDRAFKLSNDLLGAYDEVSVTGQVLRDRAAPFWSWVEVNARRYGGLWRNAIEDGKATQMAGKMAAKTLAGVAIKSPLIAYRVGKFVVTANLVTAAMAAWNYLLWGDEEDDLPETVQRQPHLIVGRDAKGQVMYMTLSPAFSDYLEWFGADDIHHHVRDYLTGKRTLKEIVTEMAKSPVNKLAGTLGGWAKAPAEAIMGRTIYPDVFKPRAIRDRWEHLAASLGLRQEYQALMGRPLRGDPDDSRTERYLKAAAGKLVFRADPGESAYHDARSLKADWGKSQGKNTDSFTLSPRSNALYYFKLAVRYGDRDAARKYMAEYGDLGGTKEGLKDSLASLNPLHGLSAKDEKKFLESLSPVERETVQRAKQFYQEMTREREYRQMPEYQALKRR